MVEDSLKQKVFTISCHGLYTLILFFLYIFLAFYYGLGSHIYTFWLFTLKDFIISFGSLIITIYLINSSPYLYPSGYLSLFGAFCHRLYITYFYDVAIIHLMHCAVILFLFSSAPLFVSLFWGLSVHGESNFCPHVMWYILYKNNPNKQVFLTCNFIVLQNPPKP